MRSSPAYSSPTFSCQRQERGERSALLTLSGDLDHFSAPQFHEATRELLQDGCRQLTVDLGRVEFMDSAGLASLVTLYRECQEAGCEILFRDDTGRQEQLFALAGMDRRLPFAPPQLPPASADVL